MFIKKVFIVSTIQEKNITYPIDSKLHKKTVRKVLDTVHKLELQLILLLDSIDDSNHSFHDDEFIAILNNPNSG